MGIDTSMYGNIRPFEIPTPADSAMKAMNLQSVALRNQQAAREGVVADREFQDKEAVRTAISQNVGPDGQVNRSKAMSDLYKTNPSAAMNLRNQFMQMDQQDRELHAKQLDDKINQMGIASQMAMSAKDQPTYELMLKNMQTMGLDTSHMPTQFDPSLMQRYSYLSTKQSERLSAEKEQFDQYYKTNELALKNREVDVKLAEFKDKRGDKDAGANEKRTIALKDDLDPNKARGGNLAKSQLMINSADRVDALFQQFPDGNIPKSQTVELSNAVAALIGGGSAQSQQQINEITPHSLVGDATAIASWLTNEPLGANQKEFTNLLRETAARERETAEYQVRTAQVQRLGAHGRLKESDPETYWSILHGYGIDPGDIRDGKYVRGGGDKSLAGQAKQIAKAMKGATSAPAAPGTPQAAGTAPAQPAAAKAAPVAPPAGTVRVRAPTGEIKYIPQALVPQALAAGGQKVPDGQ